MYRIPVVSLRMVKEKSHPYASRTIGTSGDAYQLLRSLIEDQDRESFWLVCLDTKNRVTTLSQVALGSLSSAIVHPREVFKTALLANAAAVLFAHGHPSGDPNPSAEDCSLTKRLVDAGKVLGIRVLDHIIIGDGKYYSFADEGGL